MNSKRVRSSAFRRSSPGSDKPRPPPISTDEANRWRVLLVKTDSRLGQASPSTHSAREANQWRVLLVATDSRLGQASPSTPIAPAKPTVEGFACQNRSRLGQASPSTPIAPAKPTVEGFACQNRSSSDKPRPPPIVPTKPIGGGLRLSLPAARQIDSIQSCQINSPICP
jgi:hypothetical protein